MTILLKIVDVTKKFGDYIILNKINLSVDSGKIFTLVGPNGAGKTTLVKCIVGLLNPDNGRIFLNGEDITEKPPHKRDIGVVLQGTPLLPLKNVYEHISLPLNGIVDKQYIKETIFDIANKLNISNLLNKKITELSGGEKQKVAIATALVRKPKLLILDEPFTNLDLEYRNSLYKFLFKLKSENITIFLVTHIIDDFIYMSDSIGIMINGRMVDYGSPSYLFYKSDNYYAKIMFKEPFTSIIYINGESIPKFLIEKIDKSVSRNKYLAIISYKDAIAYIGQRNDGRVVKTIDWDGTKIAAVKLNDSSIIYTRIKNNVKTYDNVSIKLNNDIRLFEVKCDYNE